jgi:hypothetical protein
MISALIKPDAGFRDGEMLAIEPAIRSARKEDQRCARRFAHDVVDRFGEPQPFAAFLVPKDYRRSPRLIDLEGEHEDRRAVFVAPQNERRGEARSVERTFYDQDHGSDAIAEDASAESGEQARHETGL